MPNENKDMKKLDQALKNMPKPSLTKRQRQNIHQNIMQSNTPPKFKKYSAVLGAALVLLIFSFLIFTDTNNKEHTASNPTTSALLDQIIVMDESEYKFEDLSWFITQQQVQENTDLPSGTESKVNADEDNGSSEYKIPKEITFSDTGIEADVIVKYKFFNDLFVGGEYIINLHAEDDLIDITMELRDYLEKEFPNPSVNSLESLSEKSIKNSNSIGVEWWEGEDNIDSSSFRIDVLNQSEHDTYAISIRVDAAESKTEDILGDELGVHPLATDQALISALQQEFNIEDKVNIEEIDKVDDHVFGILTIESSTPKESVFYTTEENDGWEIHEIDIAELDPDTPFTHHELLGELEKDAKPFKLTAGYLNDQAIQDILITHQDGNMSMLTIRPDQQAYLHIDVEHEEVSEEAFSIKSIAGLVEEEQVLFEYTW